MRTAQQGDRVQVHYVIRSHDEAAPSSRVRAEFEMTVGVDHPRLPGLGLALVGLAPGQQVTITVPPEQAFGAYDPDRIYRLSRSRFSKGPVPAVGQWLRLTDRHGRRRRVRILKLDDRAVVVDNNHRWAGKTVDLEVQLLDIRTPDSSAN